ncbi:MAG: ATPase domain-containing protein [Zestosphaera sp.]
MEQYRLGVEGLDEALKEVVRPGTLLVVAGHPGTGKTTLASVICYSNAVRGNKCLYVSFQETKEKLLRVAMSLGMDFNEIEAKGLYSFLRMPVIKSLEYAIEHINSYVAGMSPKVVVIDPINALLEGMEGVDKRAWLQNYFYNLPQVTSGLGVLVAEIPVGEERVELGAIEFVADAILILKRRVERGLLSRVIEIRKARESPLQFVEIPFHIVEGKGIEVLIPQMQRKPGKRLEYYEVRAPVLRGFIEKLPVDGVVVYQHPPDARIYTPLYFMIDIALRYDLRALIISFTETPYRVVETLKGMVTQELKFNEVEVNNLLSKHLITVEHINPYSMPLSEIWLHLTNLITTYKPNALILHGVNALYTLLATEDLATSIAGVFNALQLLKSMGVLTIITHSYVEPKIQNFITSTCDLVLRLYYKIKEDSVDIYIYAWKHGSPPNIYRLDLNEVVGSVREYFQRIIK